MSFLFLAGWPPRPFCDPRLSGEVRRNAHRNPAKWREVAENNRHEKSAKLVTDKGLFSFAAQKCGGADEWSGRKLKRPCGELNRRQRSVMGIECRRWGNRDSEEGAEVEVVARDRK